MTDPRYFDTPQWLRALAGHVDANGLAHTIINVKGDAPNFQIYPIGYVEANRHLRVMVDWMRTMTDKQGKPGVDLIRVDAIGEDRVHLRVSGALIDGSPAELIALPDERENQALAQELGAALAEGDILTMDVVVRAAARMDTPAVAT